MNNLLSRVAMVASSSNVPRAAVPAVIHGKGARARAEAAVDRIEVGGSTANSPMLLLVAAGPDAPAAKGGYGAERKSHRSPPLASVNRSRGRHAPKLCFQSSRWFSGSC